jgi:hypothetical protein
MDPATARLALKFQLDDVEDALRELAPPGTDAAPAAEVAALEALRDELVEKWQQVTGQYLASHIPREENRNRIAFKHLLSGEEQAERTFPNVPGRRVRRSTDTVKVTMAWPAILPVDLHDNSLCRRRSEPPTLIPPSCESRTMAARKESSCSKASHPRSLATTK